MHSILDITQVNELRKRLKGIGCELSFVQCRLAKIAIKNTKFAALTPLLNGGQNSIVFSTSPVHLVKAILEHTKLFPNDFVVMGGSFEGSPVNQARLLEISELELDEKKRMEVSMKRLAALIQAPMVQLYRTLDNTAKKLPFALLSVREQLEKREKESAVMALGMVSDSVVAPAL